MLSGQWRNRQHDIIPHKNLAHCDLPTLSAGFPDGIVTLCAITTMPVVSTLLYNRWHNKIYWCNWWQIAHKSRKIAVGNQQMMGLQNHVDGNNTHIDYRRAIFNFIAAPLKWSTRSWSYFLWGSKQSHNLPMNDSISLKWNCCHDKVSFCGDWNWPPRERLKSKMAS